MAARSTTWPRHAHTYRLPELLADIRLLDLLELSGSTRQASRLLQLSQPSVSRRYRALAEDFELLAAPDTAHGCRYGSNATMQLLRLSCRCHRLQAGVARLGTDLLHHDLLDGLPWLLSAPPRFRPLREWLDLVQQGVLDGALVSQLELDQAATVAVAELELHQLGSMPMALIRAATPDASTNASAPPVLVPGQGIAPGLRALLSNLGWTLRSVGGGCTTPEQWRHQMRRSGCAIPAGASAGVGSGWTEDLDQLPLADEAHSPVWLVLPRGGEAEPLLRHSLEQLRAHPALAG